jgi:hypothetical protein
MAAAVHGLGPNTDLTRANTAKVVGQALRWAGLVDDELREAWDAMEDHPAIDQVYGALIRMTLQTQRVGPGRPPERPGEVLFEGSGNWGQPGDPECPPAFPHFNSCRLTARGEQLARELLERYPQYRKTAEHG